MLGPAFRDRGDAPPMSRLTGQRATWIAILGVALAARLAVGSWWQSRLPAGTKFYFGDSDSYWQLGRAIAAGEAYQYRSPEAQVMRTPGYPLLLAGLLVALGDDPPVMAARAQSAVLGVMGVAVVGWWTSKLFDQRAGRLAGWIAALYPGAVSMGALVLAEAPFCPFMLLHLALWGLAWRASTSQRAAALAAGGGMAGAVATLMRPSWLLFLPFAAAIGLIVQPRRSRQLLVAAAMAATFALCMLPWWIRNARVTGRFVATTLQVGASLYDGLRPTADGASDMSFVAEFVARERASERGGGAEAEPFEVRLDRRLRTAAIEWARANPARVAELAWIKLVRTWNIWPNEESLRAWPLRLVILATYVPLLACGLWGAWRYSSWGWPYVLAWLPAVYFALLHAVFVGSVRYREPAMLALVALAAGVLSGATRRPPQGNVDDAVRPTS
jgi:4-amino-4-deoxy-L-arabinose transferase-like glycosyltransferase